MGGGLTYVHMNPTAAGMQVQGSALSMQTVWGVACVLAAKVQYARRCS